MKIANLFLLCTFLNFSPTINAQDVGLFLDENNRPPDYREKIVEIEGLAHRAMVYLGMSASA